MERYSISFSKIVQNGIVYDENKVPETGPQGKLQGNL
jgi:hypothetical protein